MKALISILKGIKNGVSKGFRKVKGSKMLQGALLVVVVVSIGLTIGFGIYNKGKNDGSVIEKPVVCYQDIEDIAFQEATIKEIGKIHKPMELGKYEVDTFLTTSDYVFSYNAVIKAGYGLENIKDDGGNELTQTITVTLPKASILDSYLDEKSYVQYWEGEKITANVGLDDIHKEKKRMLKEAKQDAIKGGLYEKTSDHAKVVITDYIHSLKGYENYNVVFKEANDKA
ncbi:DUF4230 domain-containing protein [Holdemanella porci]|uniref:DUF4230 domain-containing protein n=1 Tax=Holdemanella porci TaxID=2652276 RepID=UPI003F8DD462